MIDANQMLSIEQLLVIQAAFVDIIKSEISDPIILGNISRKMMALLDRRDGR